MKFEKFNFSKIRHERNLFASLLLVILITVIDLNYFFMKFVLIIPNTHWLCVIRTLLWISISIPSAIELNQWCKKKASSFKSCTSCIIGSIGLILEIALYYKFSDTLFQNAPNTPIVTIIMIVSSLYATIWAWCKTNKTSIVQK